MGLGPYPLQRTRSAGRSSVILVYGVLAGIPVDFFLKAGCPAEEKPVNRPVMRIYRFLTNMGQCWVLIWENVWKWLNRAEKRASFLYGGATNGYFALAGTKYGIRNGFALRFFPCVAVSIAVNEP